MNYSSAYHLQIDGQTERVNYIFENMLKLYFMNNPTKWEYYLHLVEFVCNNGYQTFSKMSPLEVLYGQKCRVSVTWDSPLDRLMLGLDLLMDLEHLVTKVQVNLKEAQDHQKSYGNRKRKYE